MELAIRVRTWIAWKATWGSLARLDAEVAAGAIRIEILAGKEGKWLEGGGVLRCQTELGLPEQRRSEAKCEG